MRIMLCPSAYAPHIGGVEELTHRLAVEYERQGHAVLVLTARWPRELPAREVIGGVAVRRVDYVLPARRPQTLARFGALFPQRLLALSHLIGRFHPDVVHIQCVAGQGLYLGLLREWLAFPLVVTLQGERRADAQQVYQRARIMEPMLARLLRRADYVTACSQATLDDVRDLWPGGANRAVVPNGISLDEFDAGGAGPAPHPRPYIFATGRQVRNKGFDLLIDAFAQVAARYPAVDLVLGGDGPERPALQAQAAAQGLDARVHLPGMLDRAQTVAYFRHSLFFALPSRYEAFGITNLEAMAAGRAVVAAQVGGVAEVVQPGHTGLLVPPENPAALAAALVALLDDPVRAAALGQAGREQVIARYTWPAIARQYMQLYRQVRA